MCRLYLDTSMLLFWIDKNRCYSWIRAHFFYQDNYSPDDSEKSAVLFRFMALFCLRFQRRYLIGVSSVLRASTWTWDCFGLRVLFQIQVCHAAGPDAVGRRTRRVEHPWHGSILWLHCSWLPCRRGLVFLLKIYVPLSLPHAKRIT